MSNSRLMAVWSCIAMLSCSTDFNVTGDGGEDSAPSDVETDMDVVTDQADVPMDTATMDSLDVEDGLDTTDVVEDLDAIEIPSTCGDFDIDTGEECDDGQNGDPDDGCTDACTFSCHDDTDCLDEDMCNGDETCSEETEEGRSCVAGSPREDGFVVSDDPRIICLDGVSQESECGDGFIDSGAGEFCEPPGSSDCDDMCRWGCTADDDCAGDGNICNGEEFCDMAAHVCDRRDPLVDGTECGMDPRMICLGGSCQASVCGDRFLDIVMEECDDGRDGDQANGCNDMCEYSCHESSECDDGQVCNGYELCEDVTAAGKLCVEGPDALIGTGCDDGEFCTAVDVCDGAGLCLGSGNPCDDELSCTDNNCTEMDGCSYLLMADHCLIDGSCYGSRDRNPFFECQECDPGSPFAWSNVGAGVPCTDDGQWCTSDACDGIGNCAQSVISEACLINGTCYSGGTPSPSNECEQCDPLYSLTTWSPMGAGTLCLDEGLWCTDDRCTGSGVCEHALSSGNCLIGTGCYAEWDINPHNECEQCRSTDPYGWSGVDAGAGCNEDGITCTMDQCDGSGNCDHSTILSDYCLIGGSCYYTFEVDPGSACLWCDPSLYQTEWSPASSGQPCPDEGVACTIDECSGGGSCVHPIDPNWCIIGTSCIMAGQLNPSNSCQECDPTRSQTAWSNLSYADPCNDDGVTCTNDLCNAFGTCTHPVAAGACRISGHCYWDGDSNLLNECQECNSALNPVAWSNVAEGTLCSADTYDCTLDECQAGSCQHPLVDGMCLISGECYVDGAEPLGNECKVCDPFNDPLNWTNRDYTYLCDDGIYCTIPDRCNGSGGCAGTPSTYLFGAVEIDSQGDNTCVLLDSGGVKCWGSGGDGQNGNGSYGGISAPDDVIGLTSGVAQVTVGSYHACARMTDGTARCWGSNEYGQLGIGSVGGDFAAPQNVVDLGANVIWISAGGNHTCAALSNSRVQCWGYNYWGQLGNGTSGSGTEKGTPTHVSNPTNSGLLTGIDHVSTGGSFSCAKVSTTGEVLCWGFGGYGNLGNDGVNPSALPVYVVNYTGTTSHLPDAYLPDSNGNHTCVLTPGGYPKCWGWNNYGQLGEGTPSPWPTQRNAPEWVELTAGLPNSDNLTIAAGSQHTCSVRYSNAYCWGSNIYGQLGDGNIGTTFNRNSSSPVLHDSGGILLVGVTDVAAGNSHTCAIVGAAGNVMCWGRRNVGQLGDGIYSGATSAYPVMTLCD